MESEDKLRMWIAITGMICGTIIYTINTLWG